MPKQRLPVFIKTNRTNLGGREEESRARKWLRQSYNLNKQRRVTKFSRASSKDEEAEIWFLSEQAAYQELIYVEYEFESN